MASCPACGQVFANHYQLGPHRRVCVPIIITEPVNTEPIITETIFTEPILQLSQQNVDLRDCANRCKSGTIVPIQFHNRPPQVVNNLARDYRELQQMWQEHVRRTYACCSPTFWDIWHAIRGQTTVCQDAVLQATKAIVNPALQTGPWPGSNRTLRSMIQRESIPFWDNILETHTIDLSKYHLPTCDSVKFSFVDPCYTWIQRCNVLHEENLDLIWDPVSMRHPVTDEEMYGGGIEYGLLLRAATARIPEGTHVALMNLSWDSGNTPYLGRSACPICLQVMNVNSGSPLSVGLLGYLPVIHHGSKKHKNYADAEHHVKQTCIGFILSSIEARAVFGFKCTIGADTFTMYPRLGAMSLDSPERLKYFGLRSYHACGICRLRAGRSVTRLATRHRPDMITRLYDECNADVRGRVRKQERDVCRRKLHRHGFNYEKRCRLTHYADRCLVHIAKFGPTMFAGLVRYERMHVYFLGYCGYLLELLLKCTNKKHFTYINKIVSRCHHFRNSRTGAVHPRLPSITSLTHLTAEKTVRAVFYWAHVLGTRADVIDAPCRIHARTAVAKLQLILIATRGHRSYTGTEMDAIFIGAGRQFFTAMEFMTQYKHDIRIAKQQQDHDRNPDKYAAPKPFQRVQR